MSRWQADPAALLAAKADFDAAMEPLFLTHDGRLVAAFLAERTSAAYRTLRVIGAESPESLRKLFDYLYAEACREPEVAPTVIYAEADTLRTKQ